MSGTSISARWGQKNRTRKRELNNSWNAHHPEQRQAASRARHDELYARNTALIERLKAQPCADCGGRFDPICMDFDHRPGEVKKHNIAELKSRFRTEAVLAEIAKCDLVCSNCHRLRTKRSGVWDRRPPRQAPAKPQLNLFNQGNKP